tara:strand:+ start:1286 stop:1630 length:345 start_codon:yes stop_codon:yes gene_type:complete
MNNIPSLIEPGTKYFIRGTLKQCHSFKERYTNTIFNIGAALALFTTVGVILWWRYKGKLTAQDIAIKNRQKQEYIISKLQQLSAIRKQQNKNANMITDLPTFDRQPELYNLRGV